ncbi:hypothetical protein [Rhodohalobacter sp.]|uniref:hypothetical protein n=1 Tax=Rhodohalobacter sp. TaxID=1974210 RepID=UPI002ACE4C8E|nr:hypothetical protein [Rhodohalobacter sp.]
MGAAVENEQDSQQFMLPVGLPIFAAYMLNTKVMQAPDSTLSTIVSLISVDGPHQYDIENSLYFCSRLADPAVHYFDDPDFPRNHVAGR